jgi:hypothetical protein
VKSWSHFLSSTYKSCDIQKILVAGSTCCLIGMCAGYVAFQYLVPSPVASESTFVEYYDKRWIISLYFAAIAVIYFPVGANRLIDVLFRKDTEHSLKGIKKQSSSFFLRLLTSATFGLIFCAIEMGWHSADIFQRLVDSHEVVHLGSLQGILRGATPYVGAHSQYGPGYQTLCFLWMHYFSFSLQGFRTFFLLSNYFEEWIKFSILLFAFGATRGTLAVLASIAFWRGGLLSFSGWGVGFRWLGPLVVGAILPRIIWSGPLYYHRNLKTACLGCSVGVLAWFAVENFTSCLLAGSLIYYSAFGTRNLDLKETITQWGLFVSAAVAFWLALLTISVGVGNLSAAIILSFRSGFLWAQGIGNSPWRDSSDPLRIAYYFSPYCMLILTAVLLYFLKPSSDAEEQSRGSLIGLVAAAASLAPITMLRSDYPHFLGPSIVQPSLVVLTVAFLPQLISKQTITKETTRFALILIVALIYIVPQGFIAYASRLNPDLRLAWGGTISLVSRLANIHKLDSAGSTFDRRLGYTPDLNERCCSFSSMPYGQLKDMVTGIKETVGDRLTFVEHYTWTSVVYFFGDLKVPTASPDSSDDLYTRSQVRAMQKEVLENDPECLATWSAKAPTGTILLQRFKSYDETKEPQGAIVYCKQ